MPHIDTVRACKDAEYRQSLSEAERALVPAHPAGLIELTDADLEVAAGGKPPTAGVCYTVAGDNCHSRSGCMTFTGSCPGVSKVLGHCPIYYPF
jgi:mersacidin/lichenicidin family type 2 lantibiotic